MIALLLASFGCSAAYVPITPASSARLTVGPGVVFYEKVVNDLTHPSMEGRGPGTIGLERARDYLAFHFQRIGLQPAFGRSYLQPFDIPLGLSASMQSLSLVNYNQQVVVFESGDEFNALGLSTDGAFESEIIFAGYGLENRSQRFNSYAGLESTGAAGKAVIVFRGAPTDADGGSRWPMHEVRGAASFQAKAQLAAKHGAAALIIVDPPGQPLRGKLQNALSTAAKKTAPIPVFHLSITGLKRMLTAADRDAEQTLNRWRQIADSGEHDPEALFGVRLLGEVKLRPTAATMHNVVGVLPGKGRLQNEIIVIGAHYDHVGFGEFGSRSHIIEMHPGADDNASGTAGLLLIAQRLTDERRADDAPADQRTILFTAFTGEERGLLGSSHFVQQLKQINIDADRIVAMLNMDMIGRINENKLTIFGAGTGDQWTSMLRRANQRVGFDLDIHQPAPANSDHAPFVRRRIPAIHFFSGFHAQYHTHLDTADRVNHHDAVRIIDLMQQLVGDLDRQPKRLAFTGRGVTPAGDTIEAVGSSVGHGPHWADH